MSSPPPSSPTPSPSSNAARVQRVAVIGGGISGLAAAHRVLELAPQVACTLYEATDRLGGALATVQRNGYLLEQSADMFTTREPWGLDLFKRLGIENELIETNSQHRRAFVVSRGKLVPVPEGFTLMSPAKIWPIVTTPLLSPLGKLRLACEYFVPRRQGSEDESLASFVRRRFGREAFERLVQPLIGGIYTADPEKLSMQATMPQFIQMEAEFGSLIHGMRRQTARTIKPRSEANENAGSGARYGLFLTPREGMGRLPSALSAKLSSNPNQTICLNTKVESLQFRPWLDQLRGPRWFIQIAGTGPEQAFDAVVLATSGKVSSQLLAPVDVDLSRLLGGTEHAGCSVVVLGFRRDQIAHPLDGFGFVVPARENRQIIAGSFSSVKFAGRAPTDRVLLRIFVGGALQPEMNKLSDHALQTVVERELSELLGVQGAPEFCQVVRWLGAMPQYHVGHLLRVAQMEKRVASIPGLAIAGNMLRGVGVPFCIRSGEQAAESVLGTARGVT